MPKTWEQIEAMFTQTDVDHMKRVSANWPTIMDLHDEDSVLYYAAQIHAAVNSGRMPIGEPRWTRKWCRTFSIGGRAKSPTRKQSVDGITLSSLHDRRSVQRRGGAQLRRPCVSDVSQG